MPNTTTAPKMTRQHYTFIADMIGPMVAWPSHLIVLADELEATNPRFNRDKFLERAVAAWEKANPHVLEPLDDSIPY